MLVLATPIFAGDALNSLDFPEFPPTGIYISDAIQEDYERAFLLNSQFPLADEISKALFETSKPQPTTSAPVSTLTAQSIVTATTDALALTSGVTVPVNGTADSHTFYSIDVPMGTTRLVVKLSGTGLVVENNCDIFAKLATPPSASSFNARGVEGSDDETLIIGNPSPGTWNFMLLGVTDYNDVTLTATCYTGSDIILTSVPMNDQDVPFIAKFKGKVIDRDSKGITGITVRMRDPVTGASSYLTVRTDADGSFSCSVPVETEGEYTFDFYFTGIPDSAGGTAFHTVATTNSFLDARGPFDLYAYLDMAPSQLDAAELAGMQKFLSIRNGWEDGTINPVDEAIWLSNTAARLPSDADFAGQFDDGLYMVLFGIEGAGAGNNISAKPVFSVTPLAVHVSASKKKEVLEKMLSLGVIDGPAMSTIMSGKIAVISFASLSSGTEASDGNRCIFLSAREQMDVLAKIAGGAVSAVSEKKLGDSSLKMLDVPIGSGILKVVSALFIK